MKWKLPLALATLALAACGQDQPPPVPVASDPAQMPALPVVGEEVAILALGDSLFAGYGLDPGQSYPARLEAALRARGINARIVNAGVSGDTTADGLARIDFALDSLKRPPALVLVSLGGNDMLRAVPPEQTRANIDALLGKLEHRKVPVLVLGMKAAPNLGPDYQRAFDTLYPELTRKHGATLVSFFLEPVYDKPQLLQPDHIHPTLQGIDALVGSTVDRVAGALPAKAVKAAPPAPR